MPTTDFVQSLTRGLEVLSLIGQHSEGIALHEIAEALGLKPPTTHKIVRTMVNNGYVQRTTKPVRYRLGTAVFDMVRAQARTGLLRSAPEVLRALHARFPEATITLSQHRGGEIDPILRISPERPGFLERPIDRHFSPYNTATALLFQAYWTEEERTAYRRRYPFAEFAGRSWKDEDDLEASLQAARRTGYSALARNKNRFAAAVPIFDAGGTLQAALGVSMPPLWADKIGRRTIIQAIQQAAHSLAAGGLQ